MEARGVTVAFCQFAVVPLWEGDAQRVVEQRLVGLYPLLPLMRRGNRGDRETLEWAQQLVLEQIPGREHRADAYVALRVLSGIAYPVSLVTDILRRTEMQLESPVYREILEEGREE
jgi:predicted transposase YdaD